MSQYYKWREHGKRKYQNYSKLTLKEWVNKVKNGTLSEKKASDVLEFQTEAEPLRKSRKGTSFHGCWEDFFNTNEDHMCG